VSNFVIGDVHGNWDALQVMLKTLQLRPLHDRLILVGDLVNRGEHSLSVLRWAMSNNVEAILGNHDLHLLARYHGIREQRSGDQLDEVLQAPDAGEMIDWLIRQPFLVECAGWFVVHAGLHPDWHATQVRELGRAARDYLQSQPDFLEPILSAHRDRTPFSQLCGIEQVVTRE
jgi:bis(5'-nucleosyl)-tetraphosphatase (symmetrical)